jgi:hypothetical protein
VRRALFLRLTIQLSLKDRDDSRCLQAHRQSPSPCLLPSTGITRLQRSYYPVRLPPMPPPEATLRPLPSHQTGLPRLPEPPFQRTVPTTPADRAGAYVDCFPASRSLPQMAGGSAALSLSRPAQASLTLRPAGSLSRPQATFVTRLQPMRLPAQATRQLPDQSTTLRVDSSSTDDSRLRGALPVPDSCTAAKSHHSIGSSATASSKSGISRPSTLAPATASVQSPAQLSPESQARRSSFQLTRYKFLDHLVLATTSSAAADMPSGTSRPSAFAVFKLITNSNLLDCMTGRSAGFSPLRIRPV